MAIHPTLRFCCVFLLALLSPFVNAYPEGYPLVDLPRILEDVSGGTGPAIRDTIRVAHNPVDNEYLVAWHTTTGIRGIRLNTSDLTPVRGPDGRPLPSFEIVRIVEADRTPNPINADFLTTIVDFDIGYHSLDGSLNRYFLAAKVGSISSEPVDDPCGDDPGEPGAPPTDPPSLPDDCDLPPRYTQLFGNYLATEGLTANVSEWVSLANGTVSGGTGLRVIAIPSTDASLETIHVFWHSRNTNAAYNGHSGSVFGRIVAGLEGTTPSLSNQKILISVEDQNPNDENEHPANKTLLHSFALDGFDAAYDPTQERFLIVADIGEAPVLDESGTIRVSSYIAAQIVNRDLTSTTVFPDPNAYQIVSDDEGTLELWGLNRAQMGKLSPHWDKFGPKLTLGQREDNGTRRWLVTFNSKHDEFTPDCDNGTNCQSTVYRHDHFARRVRVSENGNFAVLDTSDQLLGGRSDFSADRTLIPGRASQGSIWLPELNRFVVAYHEGDADFLGPRADTFSDVPGQVHQVSSESLRLSPQNMFNSNTLFLRKLDENGQPYGNPHAINSRANRVELQAIELRWMDASLSGGFLGSTTELPLDQPVILDLQAFREPLNADLRTAAGDFEIGNLAVHITVPSGVSIDPDEFIMGDPENGYVLRPPVGFNPQFRNATLTLRNTGSHLEPFTGEIVAVMESADDRFDFLSGDERVALSITVAGNPDAEQPGDGDGDITPPSGSDEDDNDDEDIDTLPPDDSDDDDEDANGGSGGGGALGWMILGLAGFAVRHRRIS